MTHRILRGALVGDGSTDQWAPVERQPREVVLREVDCSHTQGTNQSLQTRHDFVCQIGCMLGHRQARQKTFVTRNVNLNIDMT